MTEKRKKILTVLICNLLFLIAVALVWNLLLKPVIEFPEEEIVTDGDREADHKMDGPGG